jgi:hypothetical protein
LLQFEEEEEDPKLLEMNPPQVLVVPKWNTRDPRR